MVIIVTGGAGFIGSAVVRHLIRETDDTVVNVDKLTYAGNLASIADVADDPRHRFEQVDIADANEVRRVFREHRPDAVLHLAAETHVDRSIDGPAAFVQTNVEGTLTLLECAREHVERTGRASGFRFHHVSTDEVYGSLGPEGAFTEDSPYRPSSPYSASKAAADHFVRAWGRTYGLPIVVTNCSNNYGPRQFPEKLIPLMVLKGLAEERLPVYGTGSNVRDWIFVDDHVRALLLVLRRGKDGATYNIGGESERTNLQVVRAVCSALDDVSPGRSHRKREELIEFVEDRPGHDFRYAIDTGRIRRELGWSPRESFEEGVRQTVTWYVEHPEWVRSARYCGERLGLPEQEDGRCGGTT